MFAGLESHQRRDCCGYKQGCHNIWADEAAPWISQQLGLFMYFILLVWFWVLHCVDVGSAY